MKRSTLFVIGGAVVAAVGVLVVSSRRSLVFPRWGQAYDDHGHATPWATTTLGFGPGTIGRYGCMLTSMTMAVDALGDFAWDPSDANEIVKAGAGFNGILLKLEAATSLASTGKVQAPESERIHDYQHATVDELRARLDDALAGGGVALVHVDKDHTETGDHFLMVHAKDGDGYTAADPALARDIHFSHALQADVSWGSQPVHYVAVGIAPLYRS